MGFFFFFFKFCVTLFSCRDSDTEEPVHVLKCFVLAQLHNKFTEADFPVNLQTVYKSFKLTFVLLFGENLYLFSWGHF